MSSGIGENSHPSPYEEQSPSIIISRSHHPHLPQLLDWHHQSHTASPLIVSSTTPTHYKQHSIAPTTLSLMQPACFHHRQHSSAADTSTWSHFSGVTAYFLQLPALKNSILPLLIRDSGRANPKFTIHIILLKNFLWPSTKAITHGGLLSHCFKDITSRYPGESINRLP